MVMSRVKASPRPFFFSHTVSGPKKLWWETLGMRLSWLVTSCWGGGVR